MSIFTQARIIGCLILAGISVFSALVHWFLGHDNAERNSLLWAIVWLILANQ